jgi:diguanylate cyclase (GGDEF)-like protein
LSHPKRNAIRVLVVDDEAAVRDAYSHILTEPNVSGENAAFHTLRERLFSKGPEPSIAQFQPRQQTFAPVFCDGAEAAVAAVRQAAAEDNPFAVAFLDMRMPPGPDGVWAASRIRELDPAIEIVICTAFSDVDPVEIGRIVPPDEKLSYLQKPFHPHEVRQTTISLASKWRAERRIVQLAYFDPMTGLPNREQSRNRLQSSIEAARVAGQMLAVLYIDLDDFKRVNDTLGHAVGDELLKVVASRLRGALQPNGDRGADADPLSQSNFIGRLGGDEFVALLPGIASAEEASQAALRLLMELQAPMHLAANTVVVTPSIGIALYPADGRDVDTLMGNADLAMYFAKRTGPGLHALFEAAMNAAAVRRFDLEGKLRHAVERGEFSLHYQPQFDVLTGQVSGIEALLRWSNPDLGPVPPVDFIPVAEETGLILPIGEWVLRTACSQIKAWVDEGLHVPRVAVNVSGRQFMRKEFPSLVAAIIQETGIEPSMLELEITESVVMKDESWTEVVLRQLKDQGVQIAIDDFGTGYSSFGRLRNFSVDRLKIDRSFIKSLIECSDDRAIAVAIIAMSRSLRMNVTAEGVESLPQLLFLQEHDCQEAQGYLFSRALPATEAHALLRRVAQLEDESRTQRLKAIME